MNGTRSIHNECARRALCYIWVPKKWRFSVLRPELRSTWCSPLVLLWFLELLFLETAIAAPLILCSALTVSECQKSSSNLICACSPFCKTFSTPTGGDNARVPEETFWWETDPDLPVSPFLGHLYFHKDLSKWNFYSIYSILHWSREKQCPFAILFLQQVNHFRFGAPGWINNCKSMILCFLYSVQWDSVLKSKVFSSWQCLLMLVVLCPVFKVLGFTFTFALF